MLFGCFASAWGFSTSSQQILGALNQDRRRRHPPHRLVASSLRRLKRDPATADIRIITMSAETRLLQLDPERLPADVVLPKPFDLKVVVAAVEAGAPGVAYQAMASD
jgi:hypothetical protein